MRVIMRIAPALLAAAAACGERPGQADVEIEARPVSREAVRAESLTSVRSASHTIRVRQTIRVPDPCHELTGDLLHNSGQLTLRVQPRPHGRRCPPEEAYLAYSARIRDLPPGRYDLRVVHVPVERRAPSEVVLEHPVVVLERSVQVP